MEAIISERLCLVKLERSGLYIMLRNFELYFVLTILLLAVCSPSAVYAEDVLVDHHWIFSKNHLERTTLKAVKGPDGEILGDIYFTLNSGDKLGAAVFDGTSNSIMLSEKSSLINLPKKEISVEAWVNVNRAMEWGGIVGAVSDNGNDESGWLLGFKKKRFCFAIATTDKQSLTYLTAKSDFKLGKWYHVVGRYDGKIHQLYVNGKLAASDQSRSGDIFYPTSDTFYEIGAYHDSNEYHRLTGMIHEVSVSSRLLTAEQISSRFHAKQNKLPAMMTKPLPYRLTRSPYAWYEPNGDVTICWETISKMPTLLYYGEVGLLDKQIIDEIPKQKHRVRLTGLKQRQQYDYLISILKQGKELNSKKYSLDTTFNYCPRPLPDVGSPFPQDETAKQYANAAKHILQQTGITKGYCLVYGFGNGQLAYELAKQSELIIVGVDDDANRTAQVRKRLSSAKAYGPRITVRYVESLDKLPVSRDFANLIVSDSFITQGKPVGSAKEVYRVLRPAGGTLFLGQPSGISQQLSKADLEKWLQQTGLKFSVVENQSGLWGSGKRGAVAGAGTWTHQYGDAGNSAFGGETLGGVTRTTDLEVQWVGLPGADFGIDRQARLSAPLAINGRLFHQGMNRMIALDAYNGAFLWMLEIGDLRRANIPRDAANWCADAEQLYVVIKGECWVIDAYTGTRKSVLQLPNDKKQSTHEWGYIANVGDMLFGSSVKQGNIYTEFWGRERWNDGKGSAGDGTDKVTSDDLFAYDKQTGKKIWIYQNGAIINTSIAIGDGRVYFVESRHPKVKEMVSGRAKMLSAKDRRRGRNNGVAKEMLWRDQYLVALDAGTGKKLWEEPVDTVDGRVVFYLVYAEGRLVISSSAFGEYHVYNYDAKTGKQQWHVEQKWTRDNHGAHNQHPAVVAGKIYQVPHVYDLKTGKLLGTNMMGGSIGRKCGTYAATENAILYRGASKLSMWEMESDYVSDWPRLRSSCWLSSIPAAGMILSPEGGGGCSCGNWMETSFGFAPTQPVIKTNKE